MAKLTRESRLRERRLDKKARKDARKQAAAQDTDPAHPTAGTPTDDLTPPQEALDTSAAS